MLLCLLLWLQFREGFIENSTVHKVSKKFGSFTATRVSNRFIFRHTKPCFVSQYRVAA